MDLDHPRGGHRAPNQTTHIKPAEASAHVNFRDERLAFTPVYVLIGAYRLVTDKNLYLPMWKKCKHGFIRGTAVGLVWVLATFSIQLKFVKTFLRNSPRVMGLSHDSLFGYQLPFTVTTYAALLLILDQLTYILKFFLKKNLRIARDRAWEHTLHSRGKGPEFWGPYVEEWAVPPLVKRSSKWQNKVVGYAFRAAFISLGMYPIIGIPLRAYFGAVDMSRHLHRRYFEAKKMKREQIEVFMLERRRDYLAFGFTSALLERIPIFGLIFQISNRVGAAMWAHDLEKRQHAFASGELRPTKVTNSPILTQDRPMVGSLTDKNHKSL